MNLDFSVIFAGNNFKILMYGFESTIVYSIAGFILSIGIGTIIAFAQMSKIKALKGISVFYLSWFRGTPLLVQLFLLYYSLPMVFHINTIPWICGVIGMGMYSGSYSSQIIRGAIQSIDKRQMEAGRSLGFSYTQTMIKIIIPQSISRMLAPLTNEFISLTKNSTLLSTITVAELFREGNILISNTYRTIEILLFMSILYYIFNNTIGYFGSLLEKKNSTGGELR